MNVSAFYNMMSIVSFQKLQIERNKKNMGNKSQYCGICILCSGTSPVQSQQGGKQGGFCLGGFWQRVFFVQGGFWQRGFWSKGVFGRGFFWLRGVLSEGGFGEGFFGKVGFGKGAYVLEPFLTCHLCCTLSLSKVCRRPPPLHIYLPRSDRRSVDQRVTCATVAKVTPIVHGNARRHLDTVRRRHVRRCVAT